MTSGRILCFASIAASGAIQFPKFVLLLPLETVILGSRLSIITTSARLIICVSPRRTKTSLIFLVLLNPTLDDFYEKLNFFSVFFLGIWFKKIFNVMITSYYILADFIRNKILISIDFRITINFFIKIDIWLFKISCFFIIISHKK